MSAKTAKDAYRIVSVYLRNVKEKTAEKAIQKHGNRLDELVGEDYAPVVDMSVKAYYNIEDYVPDGEPMEILYDKMESVV